MPNDNQPGEPEEKVQGSPQTEDRELTDDELGKVSGGFIGGVLRAAYDQHKGMTTSLSNMQKQQGEQQEDISRGIR